MSSVAPDPSIFPPAKAVASGRGNAGPDRSGSGEFAKLLDDEPAREQTVRTRRGESKSPQRDDTAPAKDTPRSDAAPDARSSNKSSDKPSSETADAPEQAPAAVTKDAAAADDAGEQPGSEATETKTADVIEIVPFGLPVVEVPAVTTLVVIAAPAAPANPLLEAAPVTTPATPPGDVAVPAATAPQAAPPPAVAQPSGPSADTAPADKPAVFAPVALDAMKAQQQAAANVEKPAAQAADTSAKPAQAPTATPTEAPAHAEQTVETAVRPAAQRGATPGETANDTSARANDSAAVAKSGSELAQSLGFTAPAQHATPAQSTAAAHAAAAAAPAPAPAVPIANVAFEIAAQSLAGKSRFEIRLDPPELGRIDVRLEIDNDGHVKSRLIVERAETLDMLRRDAPQLERALQQAGLKTSDNALEFSLRDQAQHRDSDDNGSGNTHRLAVADDGLPSADAVQHNYGRLLGLGSGLDIRV